jgi:hypothetical protein
MATFEFWLKHSNLETEPSLSVAQTARARLAAVNKFYYTSCAHTFLHNIELEVEHRINQSKLLGK